MYGVLSEAGASSRQEAARVSVQTKVTWPHPHPGVAGYIQVARQHCAHVGWCSRQGTGVIHDVVTGRCELSQAVSDISIAMQEQGTAGGGSARRVDRTARMAEKSSSAVRDADATSKELASLAGSRQEVVACFKV